MDDKQAANQPGFDPPEPMAWTEKVQDEIDAESDVPAGVREATREEEREATEDYPGPESGRRGDLGDSGPGED